jgi:murein L,D-transpeptidase YafK
MYIKLVLILIALIQVPGFKEKQLQKTRVKSAYQEKEDVVKSYFTSKKLNYDGFNLFIRAFKKEETLELWVREKGGVNFKLLQTYPFCSSSGSLGPKRKEGDLQIPEGVYYINHFNPESNFHLSLGVSYPNASDKIFSDSKRPGGAIYIHGNYVTIGCIPITDDKIKEVYILAVEAKNNGQANIPIHIFPSRLDENGIRMLHQEFGDTHVSFWNNLRQVYQDFENKKELRKITVSAQGTYVIKD